jgi:hypothetical protein
MTCKHPINPITNLNPRLSQCDTHENTLQIFIVIIIWQNVLFSTDFVYVKFARYNLKGFILLTCLQLRS